MNNYILKYARHPIFKFLLYNLIQYWSSSLEYNLLVKKKNWLNTYKVVNNIFHNCLQAADTEIKVTNKCSDLDIMKLEWKVWTIALWVPHLYTRYLEHKLILKAMSVNYSFSALWITVNLLNLRCPLVLLLADISIFIATNQIAFRKMQNHTAIINFIFIAQFFHIFYIAIMNHLLAFERQNSFLGPIFYYYNIMKTNSYNMLYLHCILWLNRNLDLADLKTQLLKDENYATWIITYFNTIIWYCINKAIL